MWGLLAGGLGKLLERNQQIQEKAKHDQYRKAVTRYSPWTNMNTPQEMQLPGLMASLLGGAAQGALIGKFAGGMGEEGGNPFANLFGGGGSGKTSMNMPAGGDGGKFGSSLQRY